MARRRRRSIERRRWTMRQRSMQTWRVQQGVWSATRSWTRARAQSRPVRQTRRRAPQATPHEIVFAASPACSHHPCLESSACEAPVRSSVRSRPMKLQVMCHERVAMRVMQDAAERRGSGGQTESRPGQLRGSCGGRGGTSFHMLKTGPANWTLWYAQPA
jgi:hypothetical protein